MQRGATFKTSKPGGFTPGTDGFSTVRSQAVATMKRHDTNERGNYDADTVIFNRSSSESTSQSTPVDSGTMRQVPSGFGTTMKQQASASGTIQTHGKANGGTYVPAFAHLLRQPIDTATMQRAPWMEANSAKMQQLANTIRRLAPPAALSGTIGTMKPTISTKAVAGHGIDAPDSSESLSPEVTPSLFRSLTLHIIMTHSLKNFQISRRRFRSRFR